jgi:hypothetical protein
MLVSSSSSCDYRPTVAVSAIWWCWLAVHVCQLSRSVSFISFRFQWNLSAHWTTVFALNECMQATDENVMCNMLRYSDSSSDRTCPTHLNLNRSTWIKMWKLCEMLCHDLCMCWLHHYIATFPFWLRWSNLHPKTILSAKQTSSYLKTFYCKFALNGHLAIHLTTFTNAFCSVVWSFGWASWQWKCVFHSEVPKSQSVMTQSPRYPKKSSVYLAHVLKSQPKGIDAIQKEAKRFRSQMN